MQAKAIAATHGDKGAIIITFGDNGVRIGVHGLSFKETEEALCLGIHHNFLQMEAKD